MRRSRQVLHFAIFVLTALALTACDSYIEEARVQRDGTVEFGARAIVVCTDELQQAIWGGDPCPAIDTAIRTGDIGELPFGYELDPNEVSLVGSGEADRRTVDATWSGSVEDMSTLLVSGGSIRMLDDDRTEVIVRPSDSVLEALNSSNDATIDDARRGARWDAAEFRIKVPDLVVEHNGDDVQGRLVVWQLNAERPDEFRVVWTTEDPPRRIWWWIFASVLLAGVLIMMITLEGPAREKARTPENDSPG